MTSQVLGPEDLEAINKALAAIEMLRPDLERAKLAGIDIAEREAGINEQEVKLRKIKQAFFPNQT